MGVSRWFRPIRPRALDGLCFYAALPFRVARELRTFRPDAVLAQGAQEAALAVVGRRLARVPTRVIADIHGDPAAPARLYGSPRRRALAPLADALRSLRLRHSDGVRTISAYTSEARSRRRGRADGRVRGLHGSRAVRRVGARSAARAAGRALRRRARALQGGGRARGSVAARGAACAGGGAAPGRARRAARGGSGSRARSSGAGSVDGVALDPEVATRSTRPPFSCFRRARRASVASSWRRSAAAAPLSAAGSAASPDLVEDGVSGFSSSPATRMRSPTRSSRCSPIARSPSGSERRRTAVQPWLATPEEYARRIRELVDEVTA